MNLSKTMLAVFGTTSIASTVTMDLKVSAKFVSMRSVYRPNTTNDNDNDVFTVWVRWQRSSKPKKQLRGHRKTTESTSLRNSSSITRRALGKLCITLADYNFMIVIVLLSLLTCFHSKDIGVCVTDYGCYKRGARRARTC